MRNITRIGIISLILVGMLASLFFIPGISRAVTDYQYIHISATGDDNEHWYTPSHGWSSTNSVLSVGDNTSTVYDRDSEVVFRSVDIPAGAYITEAFLLFTSAGYSTSIPSTIIYGIDSDDVTASTSHTTFDNQPLTTASVSWTPTEWTTEYAYESPSLVSVVQEIVDRPGWIENNDMGFHWNHVTNGWDTQSVLGFYYYVSTGNKETILYVAWDTEAPTPTPTATSTPPETPTPTPTVTPIPTPTVTSTPYPLSGRITAAAEEYSLTTPIASIVLFIVLFIGGIVGMRRFSNEISPYLYLLYYVGLLGTLFFLDIMPWQVSMIMMLPVLGFGTFKLFGSGSNE